MMNQKDSISLYHMFVAAFLCISAGCTTAPRHAEPSGDAVESYLRYAEAVKRCDASHPGDGHGESCSSPYEMGRFVDHLVHSDGGALLEVLRSPKIPKKDKEEILQHLSGVIEKESPGTPHPGP